MASKEDILESLKVSHALEVSDDQEKIRRKGNKELPELKLLQIKRKNQDSGNDKEEEEEEEIDNVILLITSIDTQVKWKQISEKFKSENPDLIVNYMRFQTNKGHIGIQKKRSAELNFTSKIEVEGTNFEITKCVGDELIAFWKEHGDHFKMCNAERDKKNGKKNRF